MGEGGFFLVVEGGGVESNRFWLGREATEK